MSDKLKQIDLFEIAGNDSTDRSNTVELYDALPKYCWEKGGSEGIFPPDKELRRRCTLRGVNYEVVVSPAIIKRKKKTLMVFPGGREEIVEDALRKIAATGKARMIDSDVGVRFSLRELRAELERMGHTYSADEVKEAIMVCHGARLKVYADGGKTMISSPFFPTVGLTTRESYLADATDTYCYVTFNPLVTKSIINLSFRSYNYKVGMGISSALARFIHKRMSHYWVQASHMTPYTPKLLSFLEQSPRGLSPSMYSNARAMKNALDILIENRVIRNYTEEKLKEGRKISDIQYFIYPHEDFVKATKKANHLQAKLLEATGQDVKASPKELESFPAKTKRARA